MSQIEINETQRRIIVELLNELGEAVTEESIEGFYYNHEPIFGNMLKEPTVEDIAYLRQNCGLSPNL